MVGADAMIHVWFINQIHCTAVLEQKPNILYSIIAYAPAVTGRDSDYFLDSVQTEQKQIAKDCSLFLNIVYNLYPINWLPSAEKNFSVT